MLRTCWTCGGYGSVPGFWIGTRKKCPACNGRGHFEIATSSSSAGATITTIRHYSATTRETRPSLLRRMLRWAGRG
jgi:DnaJ-class molecular chaperone